MKSASARRGVSENSLGFEMPVISIQYPVFSVQSSVASKLNTEY
jgi:hypothetical protein